MANKRFWLGILTMVLVFGMTIIGCDDDSSDDDKETLYDPEGIWDFHLGGSENAVVTVAGNNYTFSAGGGVTDAGTFTRNGNVATMRTSTSGWNNAVMGTATLTSNTTMTLNLVEPSYVTGTFTGQKRTSDSGITLFNPEGVWDINIQGQICSVNITGNNYHFIGAGITDTGTFTRNGNAAIMRGWNNAVLGTATLTSNTTMTLNLAEPAAFITGIFTGNKRTNIGGEAGILTITGIPSKYNGKYADVEAENFNGSYDVSGFNYNSSTDTYSLVLISNGSVRLPMWQLSNSFRIIPYTGNHTFDFARIDIRGSADGDNTVVNDDFYFYFVKFTNGGATINWSSADDWNW